jgi:hypothetical protein
MFVVPVNLGSILGGLVTLFVLDLSSVALALEAFHRGDWGWFVGFLAAIVVLSLLTMGLAVFFCRVTALPKRGS